MESNKKITEGKAFPEVSTGS